MTTPISCSDNRRDLRSIVMDSWWRNNRWIGAERGHHYLIFRRSYLR